MVPDRAAVVAECRAVVEAATPAPERTFAFHIERLFNHYPPTDAKLTETERTVVLRDWRRLLGHLPTDIIAAAVDKALMQKRTFAPSLGDFNAIAEPMWKVREHLARRAREAMELMAA